MQSNRYEDIRERVQSYVDTLLELHDKTDPRHGRKSEIEKLESARLAINTWWYMYDRLLLWAQSHIVGYTMLNNDPELVQRFEALFKKELSVDSHELEFIGLMFSWNTPNNNHTLYKKTQDFFEQGNTDLSNLSMRQAISELFASTSANSSFWRFELSDALKGLNDGEVLHILQPEPLKRQGKPYSLKKWKMVALQKMYFELGKGLKKHKALDIISDALAISPETLRDWEKDFRRSYDYTFMLDAAFVAGHLSTLNEADYALAKDDDEFDEYLHLTSKFELAEYYLKFEHKTTFETIKDNLFRYRLKD